MLGVIDVFLHDRECVIDTFDATMKVSFTQKLPQGAVLSSLLFLAVMDTLDTFLRQETHLSLLADAALTYVEQKKRISRQRSF